MALFNKDKLDSVRVVLAVIAAVMSGGAALYGVYSKARTESRIETAASYETLAPEINDLKRAVEALQHERSARDTGRPSPAADTGDDGDKDDKGDKVAQGAPRRAPRASGGPVAQKPAGQTPPAAPSQTPPAAPPQEAPGTPQPQPPAAPTDPGTAPQEPGVVEEIRGKVPIDFKKAEELYRQIRKVRGQQ